MLTLDVDFMGISVSGAVAQVGVIIIKSEHDSLEFQLCYKASKSDSIFLTETYNMDYSDKSEPLLDRIYQYLKTLDKFKDALYE